MDLTVWFRLWDLLLVLVTVITFGVQTARMWSRLPKRRRALCLSLAALMVRDVEGLVENMVQHNPGGGRLVITAVIYPCVFYAVCLGAAARLAGGAEDDV